MRHFSLHFQQPQAYPDSQPEASPARILLVEDSMADFGLIREALVLHQVHCDLTLIHNGEAALHYVEQLDAGIEACPHLLILDLNLPKRSGKEVLKAVRASMPCRGIKLVVLTSSDNQKDRDDVAALGPAHYLRKPSGLDEFLELGALFRQLLTGS